MVTLDGTLCHIRLQLAKDQRGTVATNNLKTILVQEGIRQTELARATGLSVSMIGRMCNCRANGAPVTQGKVTSGVNKLIGADRYRREDLYPVG